MNQQQATEVLKGILAKGENAFSDTFGVPVGEYHESRNVFLLGYLQAAFIDVLVESHKTVLS